MIDELHASLYTMQRFKPYWLHKACISYSNHLKVNELVSGGSSSSVVHLVRDKLVPKCLHGSKLISQWTVLLSHVTIINSMALDTLLQYLAHCSCNYSLNPLKLMHAIVYTYKANTSRMGLACMHFWWPVSSCQLPLHDTRFKNLPTVTLKMDIGSQPNDWQVLLIYAVLLLHVCQSKKDVKTAIQNGITTQYLRSLLMLIRHRIQ